GADDDEERAYVSGGDTVMNVDLFLQLIFAYTLQIFNHLLGHHDAWRRYYFQSKENRDKIEADDRDYYSNIKSQAFENRLLDVYKAKLPLALSRDGSAHDLAFLLLSSIGAISFSSPLIHEVMWKEGSMEVVLKWIRWPTTFIRLATKEKEARTGS